VKKGNFLDEVFIACLDSYSILYKYGVIDSWVGRVLAFCLTHNFTVWKPAAVGL